MHGGLSGAVFEYEAQYANNDTIQALHMNWLIDCLVYNSNLSNISGMSWHHMNW